MKDQLGGTLAGLANKLFNITSYTTLSLKSTAQHWIERKQGILAGQCMPVAEPKHFQSSQDLKRSL